MSTRIYYSLEVKEKAIQLKLVKKNNKGYLINADYQK